MLGRSPLGRSPYSSFQEPTGGGSTYNDSVTESGSASDSDSAVATFAATGSEAGTASDTDAASAVFAASDTEGGTASDGSAGTVPGSGADASETATASDAESAIATFAASAAEAGSASDADAAAATFAATLTEAATAAEASSALTQQTFNVSCTEAATATDACSFPAPIQVGGGPALRDRVRGGKELKRPRKPTIDEILADLIEEVEGAPRRERKRAARAAVHALITPETTARRLRELEERLQADKIADLADDYVARTVAAAAISRIANLRAEEVHRHHVAALLLAVM
jgi:hypothetical protein